MAEEYTDAPLEPSSLLIRDMAHDERPREKAMAHGIKSLSNVELMAIIFSTGIKGKSVIDLCRDILDDNDKHLSNVARLSVQELINRYPGIGPAKAVTLLAALELGARSAEDSVMKDNPVINTSEKAYAIMKPQFLNLPHEEFWVLLLTPSAKVIRKVCVGRGGVSMTAVDVKVILRRAIEYSASAMILCHNHPSGTLSPSTHDDNLTRKICDGARMLDIKVLDHIILTDGGFYSYNDQGRLPK